MEPNDSHPQQQHHFTSYFSTTTSTTTTTTTPSPTNGLLPPHQPTDSTTPTGPHMLYPHSMGPSTTATVTGGGGAPVEAAAAAAAAAAKRKRGRPRKYGTPEQALAAKKTASSNSAAAYREKKEHQAGSSSTISSFSAYSSKKSQHASLGNAGHGFTPHVITVAEGEIPFAICVEFFLRNYQEIHPSLCLFLSNIDSQQDVTQKIMHFLQQSMREMCILSASGSILSASLSQPATSGGNISYEGRYEIISLCGSYVRTDLGGRAGGLSVCLSDTNGQIIGGGVGGPLKAAGPVQVIVGTFMLDNKKGGSGKGDASGSKLTSPVGASVPSFGFRSPVESSLMNPARANEDHPPIGGNPFTMQPTSMHMTPPRPLDWMSGPDVRTAGYDFTGRTGHGGPQSPENGDYQ
ncbi:AT-hook motif nuclear-localized protein 14 [Populus alba x Populus x berolinensis]|uniref:AT-hook motif nuclear-localized protein n=1 Tax=Populus alba x Populus x berolinensis TaxID=444605 RepID=A0AAD6LZN1_9ROSI|nr:AT-hook motif nuclear-localized protein 14 [Populus alba x Populus x berolinensis]KAJ6974736.1 AT-hook motif nuclear-localized protein 14 [Populus alba x Populus x berolinensis]